MSSGRVRDMVERTDALVRRFDARVAKKDSVGETSVMEMRYEVYEKLIVGKVYRLNGRKGKILAKHENSGQKNATGLTTGNPIVKIKWLE